MAFDLFKEVNDELDKSDNDQDAGMPDIPREVRLFLGQLGTLQNIPLYYLIPDEQYLHIAEGNDGGVLKLFRLDKEWIECLMDGALSIGAVEDRKLLLSKAMAGNYTAQVFYEDTKKMIKEQIKGLYQPDEYVDEFNKRIARKQITFLDDDQPQPSNPRPTTAQNNWTYTGFLMRSTIISGWPGVEVTAIGDDPSNPDNAEDEVETNRALKVVRMERIADDTLFCICEGIIREVEIIQPSEGLHFGLAEDEGSYYVTDSDNEEDNNDDNTQTNTPITFRADGAAGVVNIEQLMTDLPTVDDSAQFAKTMVAKPLRVYNKITWA